MENDPYEQAARELNSQVLTCLVMVAACLLALGLALNLGVFG